MSNVKTQRRADNSDIPGKAAGLPKYISPNSAHPDRGGHRWPAMMARRSIRAPAEMIETLADALREIVRKCEHFDSANDPYGSYHIPPAIEYIAREALEAYDAVNEKDSPCS